MNIRKIGHYVALMMAIAIASPVAQAVQALKFEDGDFYTSSFLSRTISRYSAEGHYLDSLALPAEYVPQGIAGMGFGTDGFLYVVAYSLQTTSVLSLDGHGFLRGTHSQPGYADKSKVVFLSDGRFLINANDHLLIFNDLSSNGVPIFTENQVEDMLELRNGNLLVLTAYSLVEIQTDGSLVRTILKNLILIDGRGFAYNPREDLIYLTMRGYTDHYYELLTVVGSTGKIINRVGYHYGTSVALTEEGMLVVGNYYQPPGIFDRDLNLLGTFDGPTQDFVLQKRAADWEPGNCPPPPIDERVTIDCRY